MRFLYSFIWCLALPLVLLRLWHRGRQEPGYRQHIAERLSFSRCKLSVAEFGCMRFRPVKHVPQNHWSVHYQKPILSIRLYWPIWHRSAGQPDKACLLTCCSNKVWCSFFTVWYEYDDGSLPPSFSARIRTIDRDWSLAKFTCSGKTGKHTRLLSECPIIWKSLKKA